MTDQIRAPWTPEQVTALNRFQREGGMHPFTCPYQGGVHNSVVLEATERGWQCPADTCGYTQEWAHAFMADPNEWPLPQTEKLMGSHRLPRLRSDGEDKCRPVEVDGETVRVRGSGELTEEGQEALAALVRAAKAKFVAEAPEQVGVLQNRLRRAHEARRAKEHQLDGIRRALCDAGFIKDNDPYGHADLEDVIRQVGEAERGEMAELRAEVAAARKFAGEMRDFCSPHAVAADYADRLLEAMDRAKEKN